MAVNGNIVSKPISLREVAQLIGYGGNDLGTLCTHQNINMWAKYKPFNHTNLFFDQDTDSSRNDRDEALRLAYYGLQVPEPTRGSLIYNVLNQRWTYKARTAPYRIADFINYNHNAKCPITLYNAEYNVYHNPTVYFVNFQQIGGYNLSFEEVFNTNTFADYHLCLYLNGTYADGSVNRKLIMSYYKNPSTGAETGSKWGVINYLTTDMINSFNGNVDVVLLATNQVLSSSSEVNKPVDVIGSYSFYPLPYNALSDVQCTITQNNVFGLSRTLNGLQPYGGRSSSWTNADRYNPWAIQQSGVLPLYFKLTSYSVIMRFAMTNTTSNEITLKKDRFKVSLERTFTSTSATSKLDLSAMLNDSGTSVSEITIPAGSTVNVGFELPNDIYRGTTSSPSSQSLSIEVSFFYANVSTAVFTQALRVTNS